MRDSWCQCGQTWTLLWPLFKGQHIENLGCHCILGRSYLFLQLASSSSHFRLAFSAKLICPKETHSKYCYMSKATSSPTFAHLRYSDKALNFCQVLHLDCIEQVWSWFLEGSAQFLIDKSTEYFPAYLATLLSAMHTSLTSMLIASLRLCCAPAKRVTRVVRQGLAHPYSAVQLNQFHSSSSPVHSFPSISTDVQ